MPVSEIERLVTIISRLPGMGARSANRIVVHLLKKKTTIMDGIIKSLTVVRNEMKNCEICNNIDTSSPCSICSDHKRNTDTICVVADISDLWSVERSGFYKGTYHILGGKLSAIDGVRPSDLDLEKLCSRIDKDDVKEVIIAMNADLDGQTTIFFVNDRIKHFPIKITTLSHGIPVGGELDYLDDGTIITAFNQRRDL